VLNRVLRHNLRNEMTVIVGKARGLAADLDSEAAADAATIEDRGMALLSLGEKARDVQALVAAEGDRHPVAVLSLVTDVVAPYREDATIAVTGPDVTVRSNREILATVVENLVENAVTHVDDPTVTVTVAADAETVTITVEDDGPGIPDHELDTLQAGTEESLQHGSGIGLWLVTWGVRTLGGDLQFAAAEPTGARVTVSLPRSTTDTGDATD
jgi:signal transduction histidine kinase